MNNTEALGFAIQWIDTVLELANRSIDVMNEVGSEHGIMHPMPHLSAPPIDDLRKLAKHSESNMERKVHAEF